MEAAGAPFRVVEAGLKRLRIPAVVPQAAAMVDPTGGVIDVDAVRAVLTRLAGRAVVHEAVSAVENTSSGVAVHTTGGQGRFGDLGACSRNRWVIPASNDARSAGTMSRSAQSPARRGAGRLVRRW
jgi:hypothetical protein